MARLTAEQWERARADYEVRGISQSDVAKRYGVTEGAVRKKVRLENWVRGESTELVRRKTNVIRELASVEEESTKLTVVQREALNDEVRTQLELDGIRRSFHCELYEKGRELLREVTNASDWKTLTSGARDLMPPQQAAASTTTVNVSQAQAQAMTPEQVCDALIARQRAEIEEAEAENGTTVAG